jgi:hypothetical protein
MFEPTGELKCYRVKTMPQRFSDPSRIQSAIMLDRRGGYILP